MNSQETERLKATLGSRLKYWEGELSKVEWLRRPNGNWNRNQGDQNQPKKVRGYWSARKKRHQKINYRIKNLLAQITQLKDPQS